MNSVGRVEVVSFLKVALRNAANLEHQIAADTFDHNLVWSHARWTADAVMKAQIAMRHVATDRRGTLNQWLHNARSEAVSCAAYANRVFRTNAVPTPGDLAAVRRRVDRLRAGIDLALDHVEQLEMRLDMVPGPGRVSRRLTRWAVRVLPAGHRIRYREEFLSELYDLRDLPGRLQLRYGLRLLVRAVVLRRALRAAEPALERTR